MGAALLLGGCNSTKSGQASDDKAITTQVQAKLFDDPVLKMRDIHVTSDNGTVTLSGSVNTELEKAAVERVADQADGVKKVVNQLEIASAGSGAEAPAPSAAATSGSTARQSEAPSEPPRASVHRHHARSVENNETTSDQVAAAETPAANPQAVAAPAAPPQPAAATAPPATPVAAPPPPPPVANPPEQITIPPGTIFTVRTVDSIDSTKSNPGDEFAASLSAPLVIGERTVFPRNTEARLRLVQSTAAGRVSGRSELKVELISVRAGGQSYPLETNYYERAGASQGKRTAEGAGGGAVLGALIGALAGRGRGAAIGSVVGAGAGTAVAATHGQQVKIPSETRLEFTLNGPVTVTLNPGT
jgi:hypothetical protein